ncbi:putative baseplate assembly protein [Synechococcus sp. PCC 7336]|uniref:putative baseplate assembly protein n=1 Tax=Synechococcus sp. PCC 7336 TaxID=195250 RepID=UPI00034C85BE|nr:putative baseplate assembly protein [Synechococcus sp. PCC 7336]
MDRSFLPQLPKSDLDDRTYQDLLDECLLRIPRYCPEWTNFNPSDPGVTLIELFAWLTDQMLLRFNQVPRRNYVAFLELLGIRLQPPAPAQTDVTFYLSVYLSLGQSPSLPRQRTLNAGIEVATVRAENDEAVIFSTDEDLELATPSIKHFLRANAALDRPDEFYDCFAAGRWTNLSEDRLWRGLEQLVFGEYPQPSHCFYVVFEESAPLEGNVISLIFEGQAGTATGIDPEQPPLRWEAWDGRAWQPVLRSLNDDATKGLSFDDLGNQQQPNAVVTSAATLHMPRQWPVDTFSGYRGRWVRAVTDSSDGQPMYRQSPQIQGLGAQTIGGTIGATQCFTVRDEVLGVSNGKPGQVFTLASRPVLPRRPEEREYIVVELPGGSIERWQEVENFAESGPNDLHYTIDSLSGEVQFGPLIREPEHLQQQTAERSRMQSGDRLPLPPDAPRERLERHYGKVPPRGAEIVMAAYRTGGGIRGNVPSKAIVQLKTAVPYVREIVNYVEARYGANAQSLEDAAIKVPTMFRTRDRAVTPEDFEVLTERGGAGQVARAYCPPQLQNSGGIVQVWVVPQASTDGIERGVGLHPDRLAMTPTLKQTLLNYLDERRLLGVQVQLESPNYVGVSVQAELGLEPKYQYADAEEEIHQQVQQALYRFLNPLTGGKDGQGWPFGTPLYRSDITAVIQPVPGVQFIRNVYLYQLRQQGDRWQRSLAQDGYIAVEPLELLCSWATELGDGVDSSHSIITIGAGVGASR